MSNENPGTYTEYHNRIHEKKEQEIVRLHVKTDEFEKTKEKIRKKKGFDIHGLRQKIEIGQSLNSLKSDMRSALSEGSISRDTYDQIMASLEHDMIDRSYPTIDPGSLPFSQNPLAKYLENQPLGRHIGVDIVGFLYGVIIQGTAIVAIIAWQILSDLFLLPRDIVREIQLFHIKK